MFKNILVRLVALSVLLSYMISCDSNPKIREGLEGMQSSKVQLFQDSMLCINGNSIIKEQEHKQLKLVVFVDSSECSSCALDRLGEWLPYLQSHNGLNGFKFLVVLESNKLDMNYAKEQIEIAGIQSPVFLDTLSIFRRHNPQIPNNKLFHTFLLDESDRVLLVGSPLRNERVDKLLRKIVNEHR